MQHFKLIIAYDGTDFFGWQIQPNAITISETLQKKFYRIFKEKIKIVGASRTDSGVHALGQVAYFKSNSPSLRDYGAMHSPSLLSTNLTPTQHCYGAMHSQIPTNKVLKAWNGLLPDSIVIRSLEKVPNTFHPCVDVVQKTYYYHLFLKRPLPFAARYGWHYDFIHKVNLDLFEKALQCYVGTHDFTSLCKQDRTNKKDPVRTIDSIKLVHLKRYGALRIEIKGKSFLRFQIRRMVGYALDVARRQELGIDYLQGILENPNPQQTLLKADASGLCLRKIVYKDEINNTRRAI